MVRPTTRFRCRHRGFTLVELLIVIAIIVVLLSVLLPAIGRSKELTRRVVCASNLHQWHLVYGNYSAEYQGWIPGAWWWELFECITSASPDDTWYESTPFWESTVCMPKYGMQLGVARCPSVTEIRISTNMQEWPKSYWGAVDYISQSGTCAGARDPVRAPMKGWEENRWDHDWLRHWLEEDYGPVWHFKLERPPNTPLLFDKHWVDHPLLSWSSYVNLSWNVGVSSNHGYKAGPRHPFQIAEGANVLTLDGRVKFLMLKRFTGADIDAGRLRPYCQDRVRFWWTDPAFID